MTGKYRTAIDNHVLRGTSALTAVSILSALHADTVVTGIKLGIHDEYILARLHVDGVSVLCITRILGQDIVHNQVFAHQRMNVPCRRVLEYQILEQHVLAVHQADHHRAQELADAEPLFFREISLRHVHLGRLFAFQITLRGIPEVIALEDATP